eukprot:Amastigsp_a847847_24.p3 type:complete len:168 gc:universal Amastigsp_a847847_24:720-217(-)
MRRVSLLCAQRDVQHLLAYFGRCGHLGVHPLRGFGRISHLGVVAADFLYLYVCARVDGGHDVLVHFPPVLRARSADAHSPRTPRLRRHCNHDSGLVCPVCLPCVLLCALHPAPLHCGDHCSGHRLCSDIASGEVRHARVPRAPHVAFPRDGALWPGAGRAHSGPPRG